MPNRDLTTVRIPLRRAKHHFGAATARGNRPANEDTDQAGTINVPAFATRPPRSHVVVRRQPGDVVPVESVYRDPQVFYFGVFDGHGGAECSDFLRDELHGYVEEAAKLLAIQSSLTKGSSSSSGGGSPPSMQACNPQTTNTKKRPEIPAEKSSSQDAIDDDGNGDTITSKDDDETQQPLPRPYWAIMPEVAGEGQFVTDENRAYFLKQDIVAEYRRAVGGYFKRFNPDYFDLAEGKGGSTGLESVLMYAFLRADLDFVTAQARKPDPADARFVELAINADEVLGAPHAPPSSGHRIGGRVRFAGGSTASVALISTPTPAPFWHPSSTATLVVAHVGDSRILICDTRTGRAHPLTSDHHPSTPSETRRLMRWAPPPARRGSQTAADSADSFGETRIAGLANSRAFGDMSSKRIGVSAEPEITRIDMGPAEHSFLVLMSDGVSGSVSDQEIVDIVKEARTPDEGARSIVEYATEVSADGDNATCLVVRLGGWERRSEGGLGSLGTKEMRDIRLAEALDPRQRKR